MLEEKIKRINTLYKKHKEQGLTEEEKIEQAKLRREYVDAVKGSLMGSLDTVKIQEQDGTIRPLTKKEDV